MINLLPNQEKQEIKLVMAGKKASVIFIYLLFSLGFLIISLTLLYYYIDLRIDEIESIIFLRNEELENYNFQEFKNSIVKVNQTLGLIQTFQGKNIYMTPFIEDIYDLPEKGISFNSIFFKKDSRTVKDKPTKEIFIDVLLTGTAATREDLYSFKKTFEQDDIFKQVYFSPDSWTKPRDAEFSVSFEIIIL